MGLAWSAIACNSNTPDKAAGPADSSQKETPAAAGANAAKDSGQTEAHAGGNPAGGNIVKSEAPDAGTRSDQGYAMPAKGKGMAQSPINILTSTSEKQSMDKISISFHGDVVAAENLGHTIQVDFGDSSTEKVSGKTYTARQFHFHTPSEHLVDGVTFPMEMHIVSTIQDSAGAKNPTYLVIGVFFKMGKENRFIREFQDFIPEEEGKKSIRTGAVIMQDLFSEISKGAPITCYSYKGSLTTPPFTEKVDWVVIARPLEASPEQILALEKKEGNNARHIQAVYERRLGGRTVAFF